MTVTWKQAAVAVGALAALHVGIGLLPGSPFTPAMNLVLFASNLYALYCASVVLKGRALRSLAFFLAGYAALFLLTVVLLDKKPLFVLLLVAYASAFGSPVALGVVGLFVLSFVVFQPYAFETFLPLLGGYVLLWRARKERAGFLLFCLGLGLAGLSLLLFPLVHMMLQDSVLTLWRALSRTEVQEALLASVLTASISTVVIAVWGIPLAYALSRYEFRGKASVEALVDLPILVPQSVAGVALIVLLGPGAPLGRALEDGLGLRVSGSYLGVVVAQVFVASPFLVKAAMTGFHGVPLQLEQAARSLGAGPAQTFLRISLPLAFRGVAVGAALAWARAISEFGCLVLFASSPVTAPILVHTEFLRAGASESRPIAVVFLVVCLWSFVVFRFGRSFLFWRRS